MTRPRYRIALSNHGGEIGAIETDAPGIMLAEVIRQALLTDWSYMHPGDSITITYNEDNED